MQKTRQVLFFTGIFLVFIISCTTRYEDIRIVKIDDPKVVKMDNAEISIQLNVMIDNPTNKKIHIHQFSVNIQDKDKVIATMNLDKKIILLKNREQSYLAEIKINLPNPLILLKFVYQPELLNTLKLNGYLKARSGILIKTVKFTDKELANIGLQQVFNSLIPK